jgi:hypothetical protein
MIVLGNRENQRSIRKSNVLPENDYLVLFDSGAECSIFRNSNLLDNIRATSTLATITGIDGGTLKIEKVGDYRGFTVFFDQRVKSNILSCSCVTDTPGKLVQFDNVQYAFSIIDTEDPYMAPIIFERIDGVYATLEEKGNFIFYMDRVNNVTSEQNKRKYTKRDVKNADLAREVQRRLGYPSDGSLSKMTSITNLPISRKDIVRANDIYGRNSAIVRGKTKFKKSKTVVIENSWKPNDELQDLHIDLMCIEGDWYLISILTPIDFVQTTQIKNRSTECLHEALNEQLTKIAKEEFEIGTIYSDGEGGISSMAQDFIASGYNFDKAGPGHHVAIVERKIQTLKGRVRSILQGLSFNLMVSLTKYLVEYATIMLNLTPSEQRVDPTSSWELFFGQKVNYKIQLKISFGDFAQCVNPHIISNSMTPRTEACIALLPVLNTQGSFMFFNLETKKVIMRNQWVESPIPIWAENLLKKWAKIASRNLRLNQQFNSLLEDSDIDIDEEDQIHLSDNDEDEFGGKSDDEINKINDEISLVDEDNQNQFTEPDENINPNISDEDETPIELRLRVENQLDQQNPIDVQGFNNLYQEVTANPEPQHRYATRSRGAAYSYGPFKDGKSLNYGVFNNSSNLTVKEALDKYGEAAEAAIIKELQQMLDLDVFEFLDPKSLSKEIIKN